MKNHEPRPVATNGVDESAAIGAHAGQDVLVENEEWLDGADLCVAVADGEVQIIELGMDRVLYNFVVAAVLVLRSKRSLPLWALSQLTARDDLDAGHRSVGRPPRLQPIARRPDAPALISHEATLRCKLQISQFLTRMSVPRSLTPNIDLPFNGHVA
jgi:hypothetical protein